MLACPPRRLSTSAIRTLCVCDMPVPLIAAVVVLLQSSHRRVVCEQPSGPPPLRVACKKFDTMTCMQRSLWKLFSNASWICTSGAVLDSLSRSCLDLQSLFLLSLLSHMYLASFSSPMSHSAAHVSRRKSSGIGLDCSRCVLCILSPRTTMMHCCVASAIGKVKNSSQDSASASCM